MECFSDGKIRMIKVKGRLIDADFLDEITKDLMIFLSRHTSGKEIPAFTVHAEGNWSNDNSLGGKPKELSVSSPSSMINVLSSINKLNKTQVGVTYEATHHGPFLNNPSFFVELGGNVSVVENKKYAEFIASAVAKILDENAPYNKIAVGLGGMHYPSKFTKLALDGKYTFSHIMSKYNIGCIDMLKKAFERSDKRAEVAVIEWKSIKAIEREVIVRELNLLGIDYAKV
jgi:D-aminoacyl-tRNA deacylase